MKLFDIINICFGKEKSEGLRFKLGSIVCRLDGRGSISFRGIGYAMKVEQNQNSWKKSRGDAILNPSKEPNPHIVITGMSGFGKSTLFKSMLRDMHYFKTSSIIFDAHDEHSPLVMELGGRIHESSISGINILSLDGSSVAERISEITGLFRKVYRLGYIQTTKLGECLWYTYRRFGARGGTDRSLNQTPKISDLLYEIGIFIRNAKGIGERNSLLHLKDRISSLNSPSFSSDTVSLSELANGIHSFSLSSIKGTEQQIIYIEELLRRLYNIMKGMPKDRGIRQYIMMDEAQFLISRSSSSSEIITSFIEEGRKYGTGVIIVTHSSCNLSKQIIANASTFISFYSREPSEVAFASKILSSGPSSEYSVRAKLSSLQKNEAIMISANDRTPKVISTASLYHAKNYETKTINLPRINFPITLERLSSITGLADEKILELARLGKIGAFEFNNDGKSELWFMHEKQNISIEHEVLVSKLSQMLKIAGITHHIHDKMYGPDIVAYYSGKKIAIEYETGRKNMEESRKMIESRAKNFSKVIIVVNENFRDRYEHAFPECDVIGAKNIHMLPHLITSGAPATESSP